MYPRGFVAILGLGIAMSGFGGVFGAQAVAAAKPAAVLPPARLSAGTAPAGESPTLWLGEEYGLAEYAIGRPTPKLYAKVHGSAESVVADSAGNVYAALIGATPAVVEYAAGTVNPLRTITQGIGIPLALTVDPFGTLSVLNGAGNSPGYVSVYASGATSPSYTIPDGYFFQGDGPHPANVSDAAGTIYVANGTGGTAGPDGNTGSVTVYAAGTGALVNTITAGIDYPNALAIDHSGNLYVANSNGNTVSIYAPGATTPTRVIDVSSPYSLALDATDNVYVAGGSQITVYRHGSFALRETIALGMGGYTGQGMVVANSRIAIPVYSGQTTAVAVYGASSGQLVYSIAPPHFVNALTFAPAP